MPDRNSAMFDAVYRNATWPELLKSGVLNVGRGLLDLGPIGLSSMGEAIYNQFRVPSAQEMRATVAGRPPVAPMPITQLATAGADDMYSRGRSALGISPEAITDVPDAVFRMAPDVLAALLTGGESLAKKGAAKKATTKAAKAAEKTAAFDDAAGRLWDVQTKPRFGFAPEELNRINAAGWADTQPERIGQFVDNIIAPEAVGNRYASGRNSLAELDSLDTMMKRSDAAPASPPPVVDPWADAETLHHGTSRQFDRFDPAAGKTNRWPNNNGGFFFSNDEKVARNFSESGTSLKEVLNADAVSEAEHAGKPLGDLHESGIRSYDDVNLETIQRHAERRLKQGYKVFRYDDNGQLQQINSAAELTPYDVDSGIAIRSGDFNPRVISTRVRGESVDLTNANRVPDDLFAALGASKDRWDRRLYDLIKRAKGDYFDKGNVREAYLEVANSPTLKEWAKSNGISKIITPDAYESGFKSTYVIDPDAIEFGNR